MRVLHVARQYAPSIGGIQSVVRGIAKHQVRLGHRVNVLTLKRSQVTGRPLGPSHEVIEGVEVFRVRHVGPRQYAVAPALPVKLGGYDIIHVHSFDFFCDYLALLHRWHRVPMVITTHGVYFHSGDPLGLKRLYLRTVTKQSLRAYRAVVAVSQADLELLKLIGQQAIVIPNGVDTQRLAGIKRQPDPATLLAVGMRSSYKRADLLEATYHLLRRIMPQTRLVLAGGETGPSRDGIERLGVVDEETLDQLLCRATLVCSASDHEGFGLATLEGMAAGVPAAVRAGHPLADAAGSGGLFCVDFQEPEKAARQLHGIIEGTDLEAASESARRFAAAYGWPAVSQRYLTVYERAVQG